MESFFNLRLPIKKELSAKEKAFSDAKYNIFVNRDRLCSAEVRYIGDRDLSNKQRDKILKPQLERLLRSYIKLLLTYDEYEPDSLEIDTILENAHNLQFRLLQCLC